MTWANRTGKGKIQYPFSHASIDCLAPAIFIAFAMPGDLSCLLPIGPKHHPSMILRQGQMDISETQGLAGPHHCKGHTRAVQFSACREGAVMRALTWKKGAPQHFSSLCPNLTCRILPITLPLLFYAHNLSLLLTQPQQETFLDLSSTQPKLFLPFSTWLLLLTTI